MFCQDLTNLINMSEINYTRLFWWNFLLRTIDSLNIYLWNNSGRENSPWLFTKFFHREKYKRLNFFTFLEYCNSCRSFFKSIFAPAVLFSAALNVSIAAVGNSFVVSLSSFVSVTQFIKLIHYQLGILICDNIITFYRCEHIIIELNPMVVKFIS